MNTMESEVMKKVERLESTVSMKTLSDKTGI